MATNQQVADILIGSATIWYAPVGETPPDPDSIDYGDPWGGNWDEVGFTKDDAPLTVAFGFEDYDVFVQQELGPVKRKRVKEEVTLETTLAEFTADHLQLAASGGTVTDTAPGVGQVGREDWEYGGDPDLAEYAWGFEGLYEDTSGTQFPVRFFLYRGTAVINGNLQFAKQPESGIPIQIKGLVDVTKAKGQKFFKLQRVTAAAT